MALGRQVVDFVRRNIEDQVRHPLAVSHIPVVQNESGPGFVQVLVKVLDRTVLNVLARRMTPCTS